MVVIVVAGGVMTMLITMEMVVAGMVMSSMVVLGILIVV